MDMDFNESVYIVEHWQDFDTHTLCLALDHLLDRCPTYRVPQAAFTKAFQ